MIYNKKGYASVWYLSVCSYYGIVSIFKDSKNCKLIFLKRES